MKEKKKLLIIKIVWSVIFVLSIIVPLIVTFSLEEGSLARTIIASICIYIVVIFLALWITALTLSCKIYNFKQQEILVYAGASKHYIKVNGKIYDEHNTIVSFTPIVLSCTLESGDKIQATITLTNRISLKINDVLYRNETNK